MPSIDTTPIEKAIRSARRKITSEIKKMVTPHMWESGYRTGRIGNSRPLKLWVNKSQSGSTTPARFSGQVLKEFWGVSEDGIIVDAWGGGCVTLGFCDFPLEDLIKLHKWINKRFTPASQTVQGSAA